MADYPEHEKLQAVSEQTQAIGEFLEWLNSQSVQLMIWREDLTDTRTTGPACPERRRGHRMDPCWPTSAIGIGGADYWDTHCLHWHGRDRDDNDDDAAAEQGICCWCGKGREYTITTRGWVSERRSTPQLLADWAGIDLDKIEAEKRQMLESIRAMQGA
jgi:hypothetical protein